ncbi:MAG: hypothetical protein ACN4GZ_14735, partial [Acidimicrobiales bacterium]
MSDPDWRIREHIVANTDQSTGTNPVDDEDKLIPGWGLAADSQIVVLGLVVLGLILASLFLGPRLFGDDSSSAAIDPTQLRPDTPEVAVDDGDDDVDAVSTSSTTSVTPDTGGGEVDLTPDVAAAVSGF